MNLRHDYRKYITSVLDFPKPGVLFKDITPLLADKTIFHDCILDFAEFIQFNFDFDVIVCPEARGFIFACPVAFYLNKPLIPIRKKLKLPRACYSCKYELEYNTVEVFMHKAEIQNFKKVLIIDDILATGGTINASVTMLQEANCEVKGIIVLAKLQHLIKKNLVENYKIHALVDY